VEVARAGPSPRSRVSTDARHPRVGRPSQGLKGGRSQYHLRQVCVFLDLYVLNKPEVLMSAFDGSFDENGKLKDTKWEGRLLEQ
jgi:NAD(P)H-dependent FMN reductase